MHQGEESLEVKGKAPILSCCVQTLASVLQFFIVSFCFLYKITINLKIIGIPPPQGSVRIKSVFVCQGCHNKIPQIGQAEQLTFTFPQFCRSKIKVLAGLLSSEVSVLGLPSHHVLKCSLCPWLYLMSLPVSKFPLPARTPARRDRDPPEGPHLNSITS